jgi:hypothetical protein
VKKSIKEKFGKKNKENFAHINQQAKPKQAMGKCLSFFQFLRRFFI